MMPAEKSINPNYSGFFPAHIKSWKHISLLKQDVSDKNINNFIEIFLLHIWNGNSLEIYLAMHFVVLVELLLNSKLSNANTLHKRRIIKTEDGVQ